MILSSRRGAGVRDYFGAVVKVPDRVLVAGVVEIVVVKVVDKTNSHFSTCK